MTAHEPSRRAATGALIVIASAGLWLRGWGASFGLPAVYNPDEAAIMTRALAFGTGDLNPHNFLYPSLYFYVLFLWEGLTFVALRTAGVYGSLAEFTRAFFVDPSWIFLSGRWLSALCGTLTLVATYRLGSRLANRTAGLVGAALLAVSPIAVRDSHYVKHDVPVTLLIVLTHVVLAGLLISPASGSRRRTWVLAGALAGLAISTHYYAVFVVLPVLLVAWVAAPEPTAASRVRHAAILATCAAGAFALTSPFVLLEPATAYRDIVANREIVMDRAVTPAGLFGSMGAYLRLLLLDGLTWLPALAACVGSVLWLRSRPRIAVLALLFPVAFVLFIANTVPASRYLNPVLPFFAVAAGVAVATFAASTRSRMGLVVIALALCARGADTSARSGNFFTQVDTRTLALQYLESTVPAGSSILVQPYSVPLRASRPSLVEALRLHLGSEARASVKFQRMLALDPYPTPAYRVIFLGRGGLDSDKIYIDPADLAGAPGLALLTAVGVEYVVLKRYNDNAPPEVEALRARLDREARRLVSFSPVGAEWADVAHLVPPFLHNTDARLDTRLDRPGPALDIWHLNR